MKRTPTLLSALERAISGSVVESAAERDALVKLLAELSESKDFLKVSPEKVRVRIKDSDRILAVESHLRTLRAAGTDRAAFDAALAATMSDPLVRNDELREIVIAYSGRKVKAKETRPNLEKLLKQSFNRDSWQIEAYGRIEKLTAAE
ncbi:hypothetical protein [Hyphomonas sp.]|uniref:hypothetical protein n=1 Tax=Hyphomonas sp. TaxID=87 RepID=UPI0039187ED3